MNLLMFNSWFWFDLCRGVKATLWEGGVRGVGFVSSPLLQKMSYVSENMFHVSDWLPTLYRAAGGDTSVLKHLDGYDMWDMLSNHDEPVRSEILHNIDPISQIAALRVGDYKLVIGQTYHGAWSGWYPPWQAQDDDSDNQLTFMSLKTHQTEAKSESWATQFYGERSVVVKCGTKPANASTNCQPTLKPCLFHIPSDPCEYNNIAAELPDMVRHMTHRLTEYNNTAVPPLNYHLPQDPAGNPKLHGGVWSPWR